MGELAKLARELQPVLDEAARAAHAPAAALAFRRGDEVADLATGTLNLGAGIEATPDSLFQIGSITKLFTATLVLQLVDEGLVDLDDPVQRFVPEFSVADPTAAAAVTIRQLLCHTSGIEGDVFDDFGRGDDTVHRYVAALAHRTQLFAPGQMFSYCNSGYVVLGRLVELARKRPWAAALREYLLDPLGVTHVATVPEEALLFRAALGYANAEDPTVPRPARQWALGWSMQPAGSMLSFSARDLLSFAAMHLAGGRAASGERLLSADAAALMQRPHAPIPGSAPPASAGLGFWISHWHTETGGFGTIVGHNGATLGGQLASLRIVPGAEVSVALLMNGGMQQDLIDTVVARVLLELAGLRTPRPPVPPGDRIQLDPARFVGRYEDAATRIEVRAGSDGELSATSTLIGALGDELGSAAHERRLAGFDATTLIELDDTPDPGSLLSFTEVDDDARTRYLHSGGRALLRVAP